MPNYDTRQETLEPNQLDRRCERSEEWRSGSSGEVLLPGVECGDGAVPVLDECVVVRERTEVKSIHKNMKV